ncbi:hypothetical protein BMS3Abin03_00440 [bacterium BMS3Abin03]|nr:hypothetical protein BMS3Abin03_00440 [bacterium BMS3Abin03]
MYVALIAMKIFGWAALITGFNIIIWIIYIILFSYNLQLIELENEKKTPDIFL